MVDAAAGGGAQRGPEAVADRLIGTPIAWRLIAAVLLLGGLVAGALIAASPAAVPIAIVGMLASVGLAIPIAIAGRRPPIVILAGVAAAAPDSAAPTISVLVPARDEGAVIGRLIGDLAAQDHRGTDGSPRFEVIVIDDRSVDGTGAVAGEAAERAGIAGAVRVIRRDGDNLADGKGAALTAAQPDACRGEAIVVLDADARVAPGFLRTLAAYLASGAVAVTARRRTNGATASWLAAAQAVEQAQDGALQRGRWTAGGCSELRGNGMTVRRNALAAVGGWRAEELTEDLDLSSRLAARLGVRVAWAIDAVVGEDPVRGWRALWRQRLRWAEGSLRRVFEHGRQVVTSPLLSRRARLDFVAYAGQLAIAPFLAGAIGIAGLNGRPAASAILIAGYLGAAGLLAWVGLGREAVIDGVSLHLAERARGAIRGSLFAFIWLAAIPGALVRLALRRGPLTFAKTSHGEALSAGPAFVERGGS